MKENIQTILNFRGLFPANDEYNVLVQRWNNMLSDKNNLVSKIDMHMYSNCLHKGSDMYE